MKGGRFMLAMAALATIGVPATTPGVVEAGYDKHSRGRPVQFPRVEAEPQHGKDGWTLIKYEWRPDGTARFMYARETGERVAVTRTQKAWL